MIQPLPPHTHSKSCFVADYSLFYTPLKIVRFRGDLEATTTTSAAAAATRATSSGDYFKLLAGH